MKTGILTRTLVVLILGMSQIGYGANRYVAKGNPGAQWPYTSWAEAAPNIQAAINAAANGDTVWVSNGVYDAGFVTNHPAGAALRTRVAVYKPITVRSVNGAAVTTIRGRQPAGNTAVRCVYLAGGAKLVGFTLRKGGTRTSGAYSDTRGGGVYGDDRTSAILTDCILADNAAYADGGGAYHGLLKRCKVQRNSGNNGGGAAESTLLHCTVTSNNASWDGGGGLMSGFSN